MPFTGAALTYIGAVARRRRRRTYGMSRARNLPVRRRRRRRRRSRSPTPTQVVDQLRPEPDAGLRPHRPRFRRREGQQGPGSGLARRSVLAADDPARRGARSRNNQYGADRRSRRATRAQIELYGPRVGSTIQAHEICDELDVGPIVAQTILQRALYVRAHFTFKLSWDYCLLDPMDIVTITDANLGLSDYPVRITAIEEDDKGLFDRHGGGD